jgi:predicted nucleic acid-binding protein
MNAMMKRIFAEHKLVLSSFVLNELKDVVRRKFSAKVKVVDKLLLKMSYDIVYTPEEMDETLFSIRDVKDYPVLYTAIIEDMDVLISGDKDFADIEIEKPEIMTPADFMAKYL